jgi:hypothetical protein
MPSPMKWPSGLHAMNCLARSFPNAAMLFTPTSEKSLRTSGPLTRMSAM